MLECVTVCPTVYCFGTAPLSILKKISVFYFLLGLLKDILLLCGILYIPWFWMSRTGPFIYYMDEIDVRQDSSKSQIWAWEVFELASLAEFPTLNPLGLAYWQLPQSGPALSCCWGEVKGTLPQVLQLVKDVASSPTLITQVSTLLPAIGRLGWRTGRRHLSPVCSLNCCIRWGTGPALLISWYQSQFFCLL